MYSPTRGQIGVLKEVLFNDLLWIFCGFILFVDFKN